MGRRKASPGSARQNMRVSFAEVAPAVSTNLLQSNSTLFPLISDINSTIAYKKKLKRVNNHRFFFSIEPLINTTTYNYFHVINTIGKQINKHTFLKEGSP